LAQATWGSSLHFKSIAVSYAHSKPSGMIMLVSRMLMSVTFMLTATPPTVAFRARRAQFPPLPAGDGQLTKPMNPLAPAAPVGPAMDLSLDGPVPVPTETGPDPALIAPANAVDDLEGLGETTPFIDDAFTQEDFFGAHSTEEEHINRAGTGRTSDIDRKIQSLEKAQLMGKIRAMQSADLADLKAKGLATKVKESLAGDNSQSMPAEQRIAGEAAVDDLAKSVLARFPEGGTESILTSDGAFDKLVKLLGIESIISEFKLTNPTIAEYVAETTAAVKKNPIFLQFARQFALLPDDVRNDVFPTGAKADGEIRKAVVYSFLLNVIGKTLMNEPMKQPDGKELLYEKMVNIFSDMSDSREEEWKPHVNLFEKMKFASVVKPFLRNKTHTLVVDQKLDPAGLAAGTGFAGMFPPGAALAGNILEAMFQDHKQGNVANAQAGFELMVEPNGQGDLHDEEWIKEDGTRTGVRRWRQPLPRAWANLYSSWNGAFVSAYKDNPMFYAKLINPVTLGMYHTDGPGAEDLYLWTRAIQLYVHIQYIKMTRADLQSREPSTEDYRSDTLTLLWGLVNEQAGEAYHHRVVQTVEPSSEKERKHHQDLRKKAEVLWKGVKMGAKL